MKRSIVLIVLGLALAFPISVHAQDPTQEPTQEVIEGDGVTVNLPDDQPTEINVEQAESPLDIATLLGVFAAGAIALGAGIAIWTRTGGNVAGTISGVAQSSEFAALLREANELIPPEVHQQTLAALKQANDLNKAFGELLTSLTENLQNKP